MDTCSSSKGLTFFLYYVLQQRGTETDSLRWRRQYYVGILQHRPQGRRLLWPAGKESRGRNATNATPFCVVSVSLLLSLLESSEVTTTYSVNVRPRFPARLPSNIYLRGRQLDGFFNLAI